MLVRLRREPGTTLEVAALVTVLSTMLAYPVALLLARLRGWQARLVLAIVLLPLWTSLLVRTFAWLVLLQRHGLINSTLLTLGIIDAPLALVNNLTGTVIGMTHVMTPFVVLPVTASLQAVDPLLYRAAQSLGANPWRAFWGVVFPLSLSGVVSGVTLVFVMSLGFYVMPSFLGGGSLRMWSNRIQTNIEVYPDWGAASVLGVVLLTCHRRGARVVVAVDGAGARPRRCGCPGVSAGTASGGATRRSGWLCVVLVFLSAPSLIVLPLSFSDDTVLRFPPQAWSSRWYAAFFASLEWREATIRSLMVATATTLVAMPIGVATALALRNRSGRWENAVRIAVLSPIFVPGVLFGVAVLFLYAQLRLNNTLLGLMLAHAAVALPFVTVLMEAGRATRPFAGGRGRQPRRSAPPRPADSDASALRPSILSAALFAFLASFDEIALAYLSRPATTPPFRGTCSAPCETASTQRSRWSLRC